MPKYFPFCFLVLAGCSQIPQSSSAPEPYIVFAEQDGYTLYESYQLVESKFETLSNEGGELQLVEVKQVDPVPDGRLYLKDPEGKVKLLTTHDNLGPSFFAEGGAFSPDMQTVYTVAVKNQSQEGIYAIDLKTLNASLILSSSEMGFELIEGTTLEASRSGELGFKAYQVQEIPAAREDNPEGTPLRLQGDSYTLELLRNKAGSLHKGQRRDLEPNYRIIQNLAGAKARVGEHLWLLPTYGGDGEIQVICGYNCGFHTETYHDHYAVDFNLPGATDYRQPVQAAITGSVYIADTCAAGTYGRKVVIKHFNNYWTLYAHLRTLDPGVLPEGADPDGPEAVDHVFNCNDPDPPAEDQELLTVSADDVIGGVGCSGIPGATCWEDTDLNNVHLHFVLRHGQGASYSTIPSEQPVQMNGIGPYYEKEKPVLPIYQPDDPVFGHLPSFQGPVYPYTDLPERPTGNLDSQEGAQHRAIIPCFPIIEFFEDEQNTPDWEPDRWYMTVGKFWSMARYTPNGPDSCKLAELVSGKENYPPYPPELGFPIAPADNRRGTWIEHKSCQVYQNGAPPLVVRPPSQCNIGQ